MLVITRTIQRDINHMVILFDRQQAADVGPEKIHAAIQVMQFVMTNPSIHKIVHSTPSFRTVLAVKCKEFRDHAAANLELQQLCEHVLQTVAGTQS